MDVPPTKAVQTGITYRTLLPGLVASVEERDAARHSGYTWNEWQDLDYRLRVDGVAYYRVTRQMEIHKEEAVSRAIDRKARTRSSRSK